MYIKEVELKNFKSFGKSVRVPLKNDFLTVTGPNGSGKSNIVDALLFALCLSSSRAMRAERLPDLIYRGEGAKNPDFAQVTVRLDNAGRSFPLDSDTIEVSRSIKVKGDKYSSSYYFNGKSCSQGELHELLAKAGITPESYNIVMQGDVTRIIEMSALERRKIIDEIAGVAEFDEKKKKAMEELDVVAERIGRVDVIIEEVADQLSHLKAERDRSLSYQAHREELSRQQAFLLLAKLKEASTELEALHEEMAALEEKGKSLQQKAEEKRQHFSEQDARLASISSEITHKGEDEQIEVKRRIEEIKGEISREAARLEMVEKSLSEADDQQKSCFKQTESLQSEARSLGEKIGDASLRAASLRGELEDQLALQGKAQESLAQADARFTSLRDELAAARQAREEAKSSLGDLVRERDRLLDATRRSGLEKEELLSGIKEAEESLSSQEQDEKLLRSELSSLNSRAMSLEKDRDDLESARQRLRREMAEGDRELQKLQSEFAKSDGRMRAAEEKAGYSRAVEAVRSAMKRQMLQGLFGTIAELGKVDSAYSAALEVAAGARLQSIVAASDAEASQAIEYLKRSQIGRATFLPLNKLERGSLPSRPEHPGVVDYALNLVDFDAKFLPAFWYVFRDTLVMDSLSSARPLMGRYRMVTLEGDLVERSGAMTGGHYRSKMKFAAEERSRAMDLSAKIASAESERSQRLDRMDRIEEQISHISREVEELNREISKKTFQMDEMGSAGPRLEKAISEKRERLAAMEGEALGYKEQLGSLEATIASSEKTLSSVQQKIDRLEEDLKGSEIPELNKKADAAGLEVKRLQERIGGIDSEMLKDRIREDALREKLDELSARRASLEGQKAEALSRKSAAAALIAELKEKLAAALAREEEIEGELHGLKGERLKLLEKTLLLQREAEQAEREWDRIEARKNATASAGGAILSRVTELRGQIESCGVDSSQEPPNSEIVAEKIRALEQAMRDMEPVNMLAIREYDHVKTRHDTLVQRRNTLAEERKAIIEKLEKYDLMKKEAFMSSFTEINQNFKQIFMELSRGEGELILEDPEEPLAAGMTIKARPAGKPFHRLEAMSGGEKSLTALSFIFSIQMHRPAPFYAMDEIDMFLDGANVERVARLIKKISARAQFIVVSLRKPMILQSKYTLGVTMQENNITTVTGIATS
ncbi:MAG: chromosome segregation protein SMC [Methanothrix sp.]|nr:chromosome segregation protein SMC [Methanothrix sp.]OYV10975.1 MAG: chromosome segregation protein [Methanosaeta sp. ASM2]